MQSWAHLLAHTAGFAAINCLSEVQQQEWFKQNGVTLFVVVTARLRRFEVPRLQSAATANFERPFTPQTWLRSPRNFGNARFRRFANFDFLTPKLDFDFGMPDPHSMDSTFCNT